ncbi:hypothetical protein TNCV_3813081 [Trichonephila clavipes]|nr:hypothetical protein TNCV_3813081 [Trichonephila clavipes]
MRSVPFRSVSIGAGRHILSDEPPFGPIFHRVDLFGHTVGAMRVPTRTVCPDVGLATRPSWRAPKLGGARSHSLSLARGLRPRTPGQTPARETPPELCTEPVHYTTQSELTELHR